MADRPISGLTEATSMTNADLFAISQGGQAKKVTWETFYTYLAVALDGHGGISSITYTPPASGSRTGTMTINYADGSSPTTVEVTDGKEITAITQYFAVSSSSSTVPSTWYTTRQNLTAEDKYLWSYFEFAFNDPESEPMETPKTVIGVYGDKGNPGEKGDTGNGITSIDYVGTLDMVDTYRITFDNGTTTTFTVTNGSSIAEVKYLSSSGLVDTYEITLTTGDTSTFDVTNGKSIEAIVPVDVTHAAGHTDVYRIDYNDGDSFTFSIYNGVNGTGAVSTVDGIEPDGTQDISLLMIGQGAPTPTTAGEIKQRYFDETNNVLYICTGIDTSGTPTTYIWQGTGVTVDSAFSSTSTNPVQNRIITGKVGTSSLNTTAQNLSDAINEHETDLTGKVDKVTGKGLSTNDFTTAYMNKIGTATLNTTAQDLSGAINEHETDLTGKVSKTGDTMVGSLYIKDDDIDLDIIPSSALYGKYLGYHDAQDRNYFYHQVTQTTTGQISSVFNVANRVPNGSAVSTVNNRITLRVNKDGTREVFVSDPAAWRSALETINIAGDTMTGDLTFANASGKTTIYKATNTNFKNTSETTNVNWINVQAYDKNDMSAGFFRVSRRVNPNRSEITLYAQAFDSGGTGRGNSLKLLVDDNANRSVELSHPAAWLSALGLDVESTTTISDIATAGSGFTITSASFAKFGKVAMLYITCKNGATALASGSYAIASLLSGKRPIINASANSGASDHTRNAYINANGTVNIHGEVAANTSVSVLSTYILA